MSDHLLQRSALISQFEEHLARASYSLTSTKRYLAVAGHFLKYLEGLHVPIDAAQPRHLTKYLTRALRQFARRHGHAPVSVEHWRGSHTAGVHRFLQCVVAQWPPIATARNPYDAFCQALCTEYAQWLRERRGLAAETISDCAAEAGRFLSWYGERKAACTLSAVAISDVDAYLQARAPLLRRVSRKRGRAANALFPALPPRYRQNRARLRALRDGAHALRIGIDPLGAEPRPGRCRDADITQ